MKRVKSIPAEEEDRISSLPDSLIHHILSFMVDTLFAAQTCFLSKRWRYILTSMPVLKLSDYYHIGESVGEDSDYAFIEFVDHVLSVRDNNSDIQRFHLEFSTYYTPLDDMYRWIANAVRHNVHELHIETTTEYGFEIPPCLCNCESLTKMELELTGRGDCSSENKIILPRELSLPRLKSLRLKLEDIWFDDDKLANRFFSSFPLLESLTVEIEWKADRDMNLCISLPKLDYFKFVCRNVELDGEVKLHAPRLASFILDSYMSTSFSLENLSSLVTADIKIHVNMEDKVPGSFYNIQAEKKEFYAQHAMRLLRGIHNVKVLMLDDSFLEALGGAPDILLDTQQPKFYNLQHWELETCLSKDCLHSIFYILQNSPNVESVTLQLHSNKHRVYPYCDKVNFNSENVGDYWEAGLSLPCMLYHLKVVEINGLLGCVNEVKFLEILLKHAIILEKVVLASYSTKKKHALREKRMKIFSEMLLKFPRASKNIIILFKF